MGCFAFLKCFSRNRKPKIHPYMTQEEMEGMKPQKPFGKKYFRLGVAPPPRGMKILFTYPNCKRGERGMCWITDNDLIYPCPPPPPPSPIPSQSERKHTPKSTHPAGTKPSGRRRPLPPSPTEMKLSSGTLPSFPTGARPSRRPVPPRPAETRASRHTLPSLPAGARPSGRPLPPLPTEARLYRRPLPPVHSGTSRSSD